MEAIRAAYLLHVTNEDREVMTMIGTDTIEVATTTGEEEEEGTRGEEVDHLLPLEETGMITRGETEIEVRQSAFTQESKWKLNKRVREVIRFSTLSTFSFPSTRRSLSCSFSLTTFDIDTASLTFSCAPTRRKGPIFASTSSKTRWQRQRT